MLIALISKLIRTTPHFPILKNCPRPKQSLIFRTIAPPLMGEFLFGVLVLSVCLFLSGLLHDRRLLMADPIFSFDAFCSFHRRLLEGEFPQWNPYSLWGRPETQWFLVPVSLILSPFFLFFKHTPDLFYLVNVIGTGITFFSIYLVGRVLGYRKVSSLAPLGLISLGGFCYYASFFQNVSFHVFFFLLIAIILRMHHRGMHVSAPSFALLFALAGGMAFGLKLEGFIYGGGLIVILFVFLAFNPPDSEQKPIRHLSYLCQLLIVLTAILLGILTTSWQFPLLAASLKMSQRISIAEGNLHYLFSWKLLRWIFKGLLLRPSFMMMALNALLILFLKSKRSNVGELSKRAFLGLATLELAVYFLIPKAASPFVANIMGIGTAIELGHQITDGNGITVMCAILSFALGVGYLLTNRKRSISLNGAAKAGLAFFAGWYVSGYSWEPWPFHSQEFYWFTHPTVAFLMGLGAMRLAERGRGWVLAVLVCFHLLGEVGCLVTSMAVGFPWMAIRGFVVEIPIQTLIMLETTLGLANFLGGLFRTNSIFWSRRFEFFFGIIGAGLFILWMPGSIQSDGHGQYLRAVKTPYMTSKISYRLKGRTDCPALWQGYDLTIHPVMRYSTEIGGQLFRIPVRNLMDVASNKNIHFLPGIASVRNTIPGYASETSNLNRIVIYGPRDKKTQVPIAWHLEQPPLMYAFIRYGLEKNFVMNDYYKMYNELVSLTGWSEGSLASRVLAEEGSGIPRAFAVRDVKKFLKVEDEYHWLQENPNPPGFPWPLVTTSDPSFQQINKTSELGVFAGKVKFLEDRPEEVILEYSGAAAGFVVLMDQWASGWNASVDGISQPIYRGYMTTRFVPVEGGRHIIRFYYRTPYLILGWAISITALIVAIFSIMALTHRRTVIPKNTPDGKKQVDNKYPHLNNRGLLAKVWSSITTLWKNIPKAVIWETLLMTVVGCLLLISLRTVLTGAKIFKNDLEYWYALFHYLHESFFNGTFALWNPFMNGGEPFWVVLNMWRLIDPVNLFFLILGKSFHSSLFYLYHLSVITNIFISLTGTYLLLRECLCKNGLLDEKYPILLLSVIFIAVSSFSRFLNDAYQINYHFIPFAFYFLIKFFERSQIRDFLFFAYFLGIYIGSASYHFTIGLFLVLIFILVTFLLDFRSRFLQLCEFTRCHGRLIILSAFLFLFLCLPMVTIYFEATRNLYPIGRTCLDRTLFEAGSAVSHGLTYAENMKTGGFFDVGQIVNFFHTLTYFPKFHFSLLILSDVFIALFVIGVVLGKNKWKYQFLAMFILTFFLILRTTTPLHRFLCILFPPLGLVRNTNYFLIFLTVFYFYFVSLGYEVVVKLFRLFRGNILFGAIFFAITILALVQLVSYEPTKAYLEDAGSFFADFFHKAERFVYLPRRDFAIPRTGYYVLEPTLYKKNTALQMLAVAPHDIREDEAVYYKEWNNMGAKDRFGAAYGVRTFFWTKNYYEIYRLGERDIDIFKSLMGVDQEVLGFKKNVIVKSDDDFKSLIKTVKGTGLKKILANAVVINQDPDLKDFHVIKSNDVEALLNLKDESKFSGKVLAYKPDYLRLFVDANDDGFLIFRDGYYQGWRAFVDGKEQKIYKANFGFKSIFIKKGTHVVSFKYLPLFYLFSLYSFSLLSFCLPGFILIAGRNHKKE
jgi:hypothetical protein